MLLLCEVGRHAGRRRSRRSPDAGRTAVVDGAVFGLLGLLVAFTFSGASTRFDARRALIVDEANAIGTAWLRLDVLDEADRAPLRELFRDYLDARLEAYGLIPDMAAVRVVLARAAGLQAEIWSRAVAGSRSSAVQSAPVVLLPALNEMFDVATARTMASEVHQPPIIFALLVVLGLICSLLAGYSMSGDAQRSWAHSIGFAAVIALTFYVILDLEYPRRGLIRVDAMDRVLVELRASMDAPAAGGS